MTRKQRKALHKARNEPPYVEVTEADLERGIIRYRERRPVRTESRLHPLVAATPKL